jgi:hypothetical protein
MTLLYRPVKKKNPAKPQDPELFFPCPVSREKVGTKQLAKELPTVLLSALRILLQYWKPAPK